MSNPTNEKQKSSRRKFTEEEDQFLSQLVAEMGPRKWEKIAKRMPNRTARQCRDRYSNYLIPGFFNGEWSKEEDELLYRKYKEYGPKWAIIKEFFKNRSPNAIKNRWNYFVSRADIHQDEDEDNSETNNVEENTAEEKEEYININNNNCNISQMVQPNYNYNYFYNYAAYNMNQLNYQMQVQMQMQHSNLNCGNSNESSEIQDLKENNAEEKEEQFFDIEIKDNSGNSLTTEDHDLYDFLQLNFDDTELFLL